MKFIADLHVHSRFSRATSRDMELPAMARVAKKKGIALVATGDFTHPEYRRLLKQQLEDSGTGLFVHEGVHFVLNVELSSIYSAHGRTRRIHNVVFVPSFETAERLSGLLEKHGKLSSDGRPTLGISSYEILARLLEIDERAYLVPAHIWTPWFSLYGSNSGFDTIEECFGDLSDRIFAVETGLSSDPPMNWRLTALDGRALISNSDAHSPSRLGREANAFDCDLTFDAIRAALERRGPGRLLHTIEFFPEEGKYHYDGHRACGVVMPPDQATASNDICPVCGRGLTIGVLHRVEQLADRTLGETPPAAAPFVSLVPLEEIVAEAEGHGRDTVGVQSVYERLIQALGDEFTVLTEAPAEEIARHSSERVALGVERMRRGEVDKTPGYDGVFGVISVLPGGKKQQAAREPEADGQPGQQLGLF